MVSTWEKEIESKHGCIDLKWGSRAEVVECCDHIWNMDIIVHGPAVVSTVITFPLDEILKVVPVDAAIEDPFNLKFLVTLNQDRWWWWLGPPTRDGVVHCRIEFHN